MKGISLDAQRAGRRSFLGGAVVAVAGSALFLREADAQALPDESLYRALAASPETLIVGQIDRNAHGAVTAAPVEWPDGTPGRYRAIELADDFPGATNSFEITYGEPAVRTYVQPAVTRAHPTGAVTRRPAITVS